MASVRSAAVRKLRRVPRKSRVVVITGASSGLGLNLARRFVREGDVVYGISRTKRRWKAIPKGLLASKQFFLLVGDLSSEQTSNRLIRRIHRKAGKIDILVNSAGYANRPVNLEKMAAREFDQNITVNLRALFFMCKHTIPFFLRQRNGLIVNIASMAGKRAVPRLSAYSASKFGVLALSQSIAKEHPNSGLKCITVCPGGMNTEMREKLFGKEDTARQQSPDFVAGVMMDVIKGKIQVESGGDIVIRHGKVTAVNPPPVP